MPDKLQVFLLALLITYILTPVVRKFAQQIEAVDKPGKRKINLRSVPNLGGLAIYLGFLLAVLLRVGLDSGFELGAILIGATLIVLLGVFDDLYQLKPAVKLMGQIIAALVLVVAGVSIQFVSHPLGEGMIYLGILGPPLTVFWIVGLTNTVNLIDGLDGLAAGVSLIAALTLLAVSIQQGQYFTAAIIAAVAGSCLGFLPYNFHPAKIFMGDSGALLIGYLLAAVSVIGALKGAAAMTLLVPILALGVPIFDTAFAIVRRFYYGRPISRADHGHLHHRLLALGWSQKQTALIVYVMSIFLGATAYLVNHLNSQNGILLVIITGIFLLYSCWRIGIFSVDLPREGRALHSESQQEQNI